MAEFTNLSSIKVAGKVESSYQGNLVGTVDALPTPSADMNGLTVLCTADNTYYTCTNNTWVKSGSFLKDTDVSAEIDADVKVVSDALSKAQTDINKTISDLADRHDSEMTAIENRATDLESDVSALQTRAGNIESDVAGLESTKADKSSLSGYVPTSRKVNNKALSADITLTASDVGALPTSGNAVSATKATQDGAGNVITATYATKTEVSNAVSSVYKAKGTISALPSSGMVDGDVYNLTVVKDGYPAGTNWLWHDNKWDALSGITDLSAYATKAELTAHTSDGDIHVTKTLKDKWDATSSTVDALQIPNVEALEAHVADDTIHVTASEKSAWTNKQDTISATAPIEFSANKVSHKTSGVTAGTYGSTSVVPKVTVDTTGHVTKVENQTITPASIGALPTGGKAADATKADYATSAGSANTATTAGSATTATNATNDGAGNKIVDTYATKTELNNGLSGKQNTLTFDSAPTSGSTNPVTSGGVFSAINTLSTTVSTLEGKVENLEGEVSTAKSYLTISVSSATGNITGRVITATPAEGTADTTATVGSGGFVTMTLNATSQYTVSCDAPEGYYAVPSQTITTATAGLVTNITFTLVKKPVVNVTVSDTSNSGYQSGRTISVTGVESATLTTDSAGKVSYTFSKTGSVTFAMTNIPTDGDCDPVIVTLENDKTHEVAMEISFGFVVGVRVKLSDGTVEYTDDAVGFTAASGTNLGSWVGHKLLEGFKPVQRSSAGAFTDLNPNDLTQTAAGGVSSITSTVADAFLEVPLTWMHLSKDSTYGYIKLSNRQVDSSYTANAFYGSDGELKNCFHYGLFFSTNSSNKAYCFEGGAPTGNVSLTNWITYSQSRGEFFDLTTACMDTLLIAMFVVLYKSLNGQTALAKGYTGGSSVQNNTILSFTSNDYGMAGSTSSDTTRMAFLWIHDFWGNMYQWVGGMSSNSSRKCCVQIGQLCTASNVDMNSTGVGPSSNISGYLSSVAFDNDAGFYPLACNGSETTLFADSGFVYASYFPSRGGYYNYGGNAGPFCLNVNYSASSTYSYLGARLSYRGGRA